MSMPVLPGLNSTAGTPGPITDLLDGLSPEQIADLVYMAQDWSDAGAPPVEVADTDASLESDVDGPAVEPLPGDNPVQHSEPTETLEDEALETPDEQEQELEAGAEDMAGLLSQVQSVATQGEGYLAQFDDLIAEAQTSEDTGGDPDSIEGLKEDAQGYVDEIADLVKEAESAAKDEDANGVAQAGLHIQEKCELLETLLQQAMVHAKPNTPAVPAEGALPDATPALSLWAQRYGRS